MAIWSTIVIAAPVVGPMLGGWISYDYVWPWIFYINIPVGLISLLSFGSFEENGKHPSPKNHWIWSA